MQGNCIYMCLYKVKYFWKERLIRSVSRKELNGWEKGVGWRHFSIYLFCAVWVTKHMNVLLIQKINEYNRSLEVTEITHHTLAAWADGSLPQISQNSPSLTPVNTLWLYVSASKCPFWPMKPAASFSRIISGPLNLLAFLVPFLSCSCLLVHTGTILTMPRFCLRTYFYCHPVRSLKTAPSHSPLGYRARYLSEEPQRSLCCWLPESASRTSLITSDNRSALHPQWLPVTLAVFPKTSSGRWIHMMHRWAF